jgi:hypothetical protein
MMETGKISETDFDSSLAWLVSREYFSAFKIHENFKSFIFLHVLNRGKCIAIGQNSMAKCCPSPVALWLCVSTSGIDLGTTETFV